MGPQGRYCCLISKIEGTISLSNLIGNHQTLYSYIFVYVFVSRFEVSLQSFMGLVFLNFEQTLNTLYSHMNGATAERPFPHYTVPSLYLYCQLWTYFNSCSSVSIVNFEQVNASWDNSWNHEIKNFCSRKIWETFLKNPFSHILNMHSIMMFSSNFHTMKEFNKYFQVRFSGFN